MEQKFDERQIFIRKQGYQYGYFLVMLLITLLLFNDLVNGQLFFSPFAMLSILMFLPVTFITAYFILNDAYYRLNELSQSGWISILLIVVGLLTAHLFVSSGNYHAIIVDGQISDELSTILYIIFSLTTGICSGYKYLQNRKSM